MALATKAKAPSLGEWESLPATSTIDPRNLRRGIHMDIIGLEGMGKSSLALTLAEVGQVGYVDIDQSVDRAKKPDGKKVRERVKVVPVRYGATALGEDAVKAECGPVYLNMEKKIKEAASTWAKGVIIDTGTEGWELIRLASFGTINPKGNRMDRLYGPVNARFRNLFRTVNRVNSRHLVTIHQMKDEYVDKVRGPDIQSVRTGKQVRAGFKEIGYLTDIVVRVSREGDVFKGIIELCKLAPLGPSLEGTELEGDNLDFAAIVAMATDTDREDWL